MPTTISARTRMILRLPRAACSSMQRAPCGRPYDGNPHDERLLREHPALVRPDVREESRGEEMGDDRREDDADGGAIADVRQDGQEDELEQRVPRKERP